MTKHCNYCGYTVFVNAAGRCNSCQTFLGPATPAVKPTTQKAKGIYLLGEIPQTVGAVLYPAGLLNVDKEFTEESLGIIGKQLPKFARPCPPSPEHGFVESRKVKSVAELEALRVETLAANPASQILICDFIDAEYNLVWTPTCVSIGAGHDGATAGKDVLTLPLAGLNPITKKLQADAGIKPEADPYIEAVTRSAFGATHVTLTQLRGGPKLESGVNIDYIPEEMVVGEVIKTNGEDLLAWAATIRGLKGKPGVVVWHPGGGLTDHYSVHCRENGIPILISREPVVDETLAPLPMPPLDPEMMKLGVATADRYAPGEHMRGAATYLSLLALHNSSAMRGPNSFWIGAASGLILKLGSAALRGESRHAHSAPVSKIRGDIYTHYIPKGISFHRASLSRVTQLLTYGFGDPRPEAHHSFGGYKWGLCGAALAPLFNAVRDLFVNPSEETAGNLTLALNIAINQAHNGGWWLNKFADVRAYNEIPKGAVDYACLAALAATEINKKVEAGEKWLPGLTKQIAKWPLTQIEPLRWRKVDLEVQPGSFVLSLKAATVPTAQRITVPVSAALVKSLIQQVGQINIEPGKVNLVTPTGEVINVWTEVPLKMEARDANKRA